MIRPLFFVRMKVLPHTLAFSFRLDYTVCGCYLSCTVISRGADAVLMMPVPIMVTFS